jgi:hypothetical protein
MACSLLAGGAKAQLMGGLTSVLQAHEVASANAAGRGADGCVGDVRVAMIGGDFERRERKVAQRFPGQYF